MRGCLSVPMAVMKYYYMTLFCCVENEALFFLSLDTTSGGMDVGLLFFNIR